MGRRKGGVQRQQGGGGKPELTAVQGEGRIETVDALCVAPAILPERSTHNTVEPSDGVKSEYRSETTSVL